MSRNYTLEDVETLRAKAHISYEEAVALLEKYDGDVAQALVELEKRGRIAGGKPEKENFGDWLARMWSKGVRTRIQISRRDTLLVNLSVIYLLAVLCFAPHIIIGSLILMLMLGCRINLVKNSAVYDDTNIQSFVSQAAENIKSSVAGFTSVDETQPRKEEARHEQSQQSAPVGENPNPAAQDSSSEGYNKITIE